MSKSATTNEPIHAGEILSDEFLIPLGLSANKFAKHINVPPNRISSIIGGRLGLSGDTALRLSKALGTTPEFWMNIQAHYELELAKDEARDDLKSIHKYAA